MLYFSYTPHCIQYYDIIFGYVQRFAGVVMMTGSAIAPDSHPRPISIRGTGEQFASV